MTGAFSPVAMSVLREFGDHIAYDTPDRAVTFVGDIRDHCQKTEAAPETAPVREDIVPCVQMIRMQKLFD